MGSEGPVGSLRSEEVRAVASQGEGLPYDPHFGEAVVHPVPHLFRGEAIEFSQEPAAERIVDRAPVIRVHQTVGPQLGALIEVGDPRRGELEEELR
jgi:hypothetical protein